MKYYTIYNSLAILIHPSPDMCLRSSFSPFSSGVHELLFKVAIPPFPPEDFSFRCFSAEQQATPRKTHICASPPDSLRLGLVKETRLSRVRSAETGSSKKRKHFPVKAALWHSGRFNAQCVQSQLTTTFGKMEKIQCFFFIQKKMQLKM